MSEERINRPNEVVRLVLFRPQPKPEKVGHNNHQVLMALRPNWSNEGILDWQITGTQRTAYEEPHEAAVERMFNREVDFEMENIIYVGGYEFNGWISHAYLMVLSDFQSEKVKVDFKSNQGYMWFDTDGKQLIVERRDEKGKLEALYPIAFDHAQMVMDALAKLPAEEE